jgi:nitronate monooxygenase
MTDTASAQRSLCSLLGIEVPIILAPIADSLELTAAVSNAGGLSILPVSWTEPKALRQVIRDTRALTDRPIAVNLVLEWDQHDRLEACLEEGITIVSFFWGDPAGYRERVHQAGGLVMHTVGGAAEARSSVDAGTDVIVAQGWEAGGHVWGGVSTMVLVPSVVDAVGATPVVAAGGIADGRGVAAAFALGASAVWLGTRFVASQEAPYDPLYKDRIVRATEADTVHSTVFNVGWPDAPHRTLRNSTIDRWEAAGSPTSGSRPGEDEVVAREPDGSPVTRYSSEPPSEGITGDLEAMALYAGQGGGLVGSIEPAAEIVRKLMDDAKHALAGAARFSQNNE